MTEDQPYRPAPPVIGTQQTSSYALCVHTDHRPKGDLDMKAATRYAIAMAEDPSTMILYGDASGRYDAAGQPLITGVATAWRRRNEVLFHLASNKISDCRYSSAEMELHAIELSLRVACSERWEDTEHAVLVYSDHARAIGGLRDWAPGARCQYDAVLSRIKALDDELAAKGVPVTVRWIKGRAGIEGHDTADVWSKALSGAKLPGPQDPYHLRTMAIVNKVKTWVKAVNEEEWMNRRSFPGIGFFRGRDNCNTATVDMRRFVREVGWEP